MYYFNGLQQKEITIYKKSNIKTALNYINVKTKNVRSDQRSLGFRVGPCHVQLTRAKKKKKKKVKNNI